MRGWTWRADLDGVPLGAYCDDERLPLRGRVALIVQALEAVQHAQFRAGTLNGKPVTEVVNLQVTFRIYSNRTKPNGSPAIPTQVAPRESPKLPPSNAPVLASAGTPPQGE